MTPSSLLISTGICSLLIFSTSQKVQAAEIIIHNGGTIVVNSGSTLLLNCNNTTIEDGGMFTLNGGDIEKRGKLIVENGGQYIRYSGSVDKCYKYFYVIPGPNGKKAIICL